MQTNTTSTATITPPDFGVDPFGYIGFFLEQSWNYIFLAVSLFILLIAYILIVRIMRKTLKAVGMGPGGATGITLVIRLFFFVMAISISINMLGTDVTTVLSITAIFGTAIGLAFSQALSNIVSGFYVLVARPFKVGDYVRIGSAEGIVREITLNYTRILLPDETKQLVPNSKIVSSEVTNFRINIQDYIQTTQEDIEEAEEDRNYRKMFRKAVTQLKKITLEEEAYRYTFDLTYHMSYDHGELRKRFEKVCDDWASVFLIRPEYQVWAAPNAGLTYRFAIIVRKPMTIIKRVGDFMNDLTTVYDTQQ